MAASGSNTAGSGAYPTLITSTACRAIFGLTAATAATNALRNNQGPDVLGPAQGLVADTLNGNYLNNNPYLDSTFNRAADLTRTRLASEFVGQGRDIAASLPARSEELQTLSSNIYGGNYQAERDRQVNAVGQAQGIDPLNQLINRIAGLVPGAGGVTTSKQPIYNTGLF